MPFSKRSTAPRGPQRAPTSGPGYAGFSLAGYMALAGTGEDELDRLRLRLARDAGVTRGLGGNLVRCFWSVESVIAGPSEVIAAALNSVTRLDLQHRAVFLQDLDHRVAALDRADAALDQLLAAVDGAADGILSLDFRALDAIFDGLDDANADDAASVELLLTLVSSPPRWIIEAPSDVTLQRLERGYIFASLWHRYVAFWVGLYRRIVRRYVSERRTRTLRAVEIFNEPDYNWTPEEMKIEGARERLVNPVGKYVTELLLGQVPMTDQGIESFELGPWGLQTPDGAWTERNRPPVGVSRFDWGPKFDWYLMCAAQLQTHTSRAIKEEARAHGAELVTVSGSVTHNNLDYLLRMRRADGAAFDHIDRIGLHPYHWVNNDVWDDLFVRPEAPDGWALVDPRTYAASYFKRFDFLSVFADPPASGDPAVDAEVRALLDGRALWITEFGIGTKILQGVNADDPDRNRFIRPRALVGASAGYDDVVWEDLWEAFVDQVDAGWLRDHAVDCFVLYGPCELDVAGLDLHDDDRTNLSLFAGDGSPRLDPAVIDRIGTLMEGVTGRSDRVPVTSRRSTPSPELYRRAWRSVGLSERARDVKTMLSIEERQLLQWLTAHYYSGEGAIVDGGPFVGGSTVPLAEGLLSAGRSDLIDVYDRFEVEPYMSELYFQEEGLVGGESFLPVFECNTAHVAQLLAVHAGDLLSKSWRGDPIEILFVDCSKTWELNDFIVSEFFPSLIGGRAVVIQQDFVFALCPWVALTMEHLADHFEPVAFAEQCSVVYFTRSAIPPDVEPVSSLSHDRQLELMDSAVGRFRGYPREVLECAKALMLAQQGDSEHADALVSRIAEHGTGHFAAKAALEQVERFR